MRRATKPSGPRATSGQRMTWPPRNRALRRPSQGPSSRSTCAARNACTVPCRRRKATTGRCSCGRAGTSGAPDATICGRPNTTPSGRCRHGPMIRPVWRCWPSCAWPACGRAGRRACAWMRPKRAGWPCARWRATRPTRSRISRSVPRCRSPASSRRRCPNRNGRWRSARNSRPPPANSGAYWSSAAARAKRTTAPGRPARPARSIRRQASGCARGRSRASWRATTLEPSPSRCRPCAAPRT